MKALAGKQAQDYESFVRQLTDSLNRHEKLIGDFKRENEELARNRKKIEIDSYLALANSFQYWDQKVGLAYDEFESYLEMLGSDFDAIIAAKFGNKEAAFKKLDADNSGSLNVTELRFLLNEIVVEQDAKL